MRRVKTSKSLENVGFISVSKSFAFPSLALVENVQNLSLLYWGPIRDETMGKALD